MFSSTLQRQEARQKEGRRKASNIEIRYLIFCELLVVDVRDVMA